ncbi:putative Ig domain-containing protein [Pseudoalteromonas sp. MMG022]|uniref:putative Ig domain-containing protein n=1 Tax=Pseudoalteromonas sp. MMG022 TaxID=2909978 RepID=UPI001F3714A5|nr:putative Ig domain-containing protein [Pseudoalteromonas sp. MMG022]MCF6437002.1 putative Ig domain-containing protein [Pseudoalteromonas sp. MMG022]
MGAIISGEGLGLFNTSTSLLNQQGKSQLGQASENVFVNAATGNLVLQHQDEQVKGLGLGLGVLRTYNSLGHFDGDNDDQWRLGFLKSISVEGTRNQAGSVVTRVTADGFAQRFNYDAAKGEYVSHQGSGAHDSLTLNSDGSATLNIDGQNIKERYDSAGRLTAMISTQGHETTISYSSGRVSQITTKTDSGTETTKLNYNAQSLLESIQTQAGTGDAHTRVYYGYDANKRLNSVKVDLTPDDNSIADGKVYETKYTYHGDSNRVHTLSQSDGTKLTIGYEAHNGDYRVKTLQDGEGNTTTYRYLSDTHTRVTLGQSQVDYHFDNNKRLTAVERVVDGQHVREEYDYNSAGQITEVRNGLGQAKTFAYDSAGNLTSQTDGDGVTVTRTYNGANQLLSETLGDNTTHYVYDSNQRLRFTLGADNAVVEYRYNTLGQRVSQHTYTQANYTSTNRSLSALQSFINSQDKTQQQLSEYSYDFRGQLSTVTRYSSVNSQGQGVDGSTTRYVYDSHGKLLQETTPRGVQTTGTDNDYSTTYSYDGLGRVLSKTDANQAQTLYTYDDANQRIGTQYANGLWHTQVFDKTGALISNAKGTSSLGNNSFGLERIYRDEHGRAIAKKDAQNSLSYTLYDKSGNTAATVSNTGTVTRLHYDRAGRVTQTVQYAQKISTAGWLSASGTLTKTLSDLDNILSAQANNEDNRTTRTLYTLGGRKQYEIDPKGYVTEYIYNDKGQLTEQKQYTEPMGDMIYRSHNSPASIDAWSMYDNDPVGATITQAFDVEYGQKVAVLTGSGRGNGYRLRENTSTYWDSDNRVISWDMNFNQSHTVYIKVNTTAGDRYLTYNPGSLAPFTNGGDRYVVYSIGDTQKGEWQTITRDLQADLHAFQPDVDIVNISAFLVRGSGKIGEVRLSGLNEQASQADARSTTMTYNAAGQLETQTDGEGYVTRYYYDKAGNEIAKRRYANKGDTASTDDRISHTYYDAQGRVAGTLSADGALTTFTYNKDGQKQSQSTYHTQIRNQAIGAPLVIPTGDKTTTHWSYTANGQVEREIRADKSMTHYSYDAMGNLVEKREYENVIAHEEFTDGEYHNVKIVDAEGGYIVPEDGRVAFNMVNNTSATWPYVSSNDTFYLSDNITATIELTTESDVTKAYFNGGLNNSLSPTNRHSVYLKQGQFIAQVIGDSASKTFENLLRAQPNTTYVITWTTSQASSTLTIYPKGHPEQAVTHTRATHEWTGQAMMVLYGYRYASDNNGVIYLDNYLLAKTPVSTERFQYDQQGRLVAALDGNQNAELGADATQGEITAKVVSEAARTEYDVLGNIRLTTDREGAQTRYYYDAQGNMRYQIDGEGQVTEYRYNAFNQRTDVLRYKTPLTAANISDNGLIGGLVTNQISNGTKSVAAYLQSAVGSGESFHEKLDYDVRGLLASKTDAEDYQTTFEYNAFAQLVKQSQQSHLSILDKQSGVKTLTHTEFAYDNRGLLETTTLSGGNISQTSSKSYDAFGRVVSTTDGNNHTKNISYTVNGDNDKVGRVVTSTQTVDGAQREIITQYDMLGRVLSVKNASGHITRYSYDDNTHTTTVTQPNGTQVKTTRNGQGLVASMTQLDAQGNELSTSAFEYDANGNVLKTLLNGELQKHTQYDKNNRVRFVTDAYGNQVETQYDKVGRVTASIVDPDGLKLTTTFEHNQHGSEVIQSEQIDTVVNGGNQSAGLINRTTTTFDSQGRATDVKVEQGNQQQSLTRYQYDGLGNKLEVIQGSGNNTVTTQYEYDALGRLAKTIKGAQVSSYHYDEHNNLVKKVSMIDERGKVELFTYNEANQLTATLVSAKHPSVGSTAYEVTRFEYDVNGQRIAKHRYDQFMVDPNEATLKKAVDDFADANTSSAVSTYTSYDENGRKSLHINADGGVTQWHYDTQSRVFEVTRWGQRAKLDSTAKTHLSAGTLTASHLTKYGDITSDSRVRTLYNDKGQARFTITLLEGANASVKESRYDAAGQLIGTIAYADTVAFSASSSITNLSSQLTNSANNRESHLFYDTAGRLRFTIDALGYVTEQRYNEVNDVVSTIAYGNSLTNHDTLNDKLNAGTLSYSDLHTHFVNSLFSNARVSHSEFNAQGQLTWQRHADGTLERYSYHDNGLKASYTNQKGATWTYRYNVAGKLEQEIGPSHTVKLWNGSTLGEKTNVQTIKTFSYDGLGNVRSISEGAIQNGQPLSGAPSATTTFEYNLAGRQTIVRQAATDHAPATATYSVYDALGRVVSSIQGQIKQHKVYDSAGNVRFNIDGEGNVTELRYNALGQQVKLIKYAAETPSSPGFAPSLDDMVDSSGALDPTNPIRLTANSDYDRTIETQYDKAGRKRQVDIGMQSTRFAYNAFGQEIKRRVLVSGTWATNTQALVSFNYYNELGQKTASVDAGNFLTTHSYNGYGELASSIEYAVAVTGTINPHTPPTGSQGNDTDGQNRQTDYYYDDMGRVTHTVYQNVKVAQETGTHFTYATKEQVIDYRQYDELGNVRAMLTTPTDNLSNPQDYRAENSSDIDNATVFEYDALGRLVNKASARKEYIGVDVISSINIAKATGEGRQVTSYNYDIFGNMVEQREHSNQLLNYNRSTGVFSMPTNDTSDRVTRHEYNNRGQLINEYNALNYKTEHHYNNQGLLQTSIAQFNEHDGTNKTLTTSYLYNNNGRVTKKSLEMTGPNANRFEFETYYNAFSEVKKDNQGVYVYNKEGLLWKTSKGDGVLKTYEYDKAGRLEKTYHALNGLTRFERDDLGNVEKIHQPSFIQNGTLIAPVVLQQHDRWGNVIELTDAATHKTKMEYNYQNKVVKELLPKVNVTYINGTTAEEDKLKNIYTYDVFGNLVSKQDANEHVHTFRYDAVGNQLKYRDAEGNERRNIYDIYGQNVFSVDATERGTASRFNKLGQVVQTGIHGMDGTSRLYRRSHSYDYDQLGNRIQTTNAVGGIAKYKYDALGNVVHSIDEMQRAKTFGFNDQGIQVLERYDSLRSSTTTQNHELSKQTNDYGFVTSINDLGGNVHTLHYGRKWDDQYQHPNSQPDTNKVATSLVYEDGQIIEREENVGRLIRRVNTLGQDLTYDYYDNGWLKSVIDHNTGAESYFEYDEVGRRTKETKASWDDLGRLIRHDTITEYDSHGRITSVTTRGHRNTAESGDPQWQAEYDIASIIYKYDAVGNRRSIDVSNKIVEVTNGVSINDIPEKKAVEGEAFTMNLLEHIVKSVVVDQVDIEVEGLPEGLSFNSITGKIEGVPKFKVVDGALKSSESFPITVTATDKSPVHGYPVYSDSTTFVLVVHNVDPIEIAPAQTLNQYTEWDVIEPFDVTDKFNLTVPSLSIARYEAENLPAGLVISEQGVVSGQIGFGAVREDGLVESQIIAIAIDEEGNEYPFDWSLSFDIKNNQPLSVKETGWYETTLAQGNAIRPEVGNIAQLFNVNVQGLEFEYGLEPYQDTTIPSWLSLSNGHLVGTPESPLEDFYQFNVYMQVKGEPSTRVNKRVEFEIIHIHTVVMNERERRTVWLNNYVEGFDSFSFPEGTSWATQIEGGGLVLRPGYLDGGAEPYLLQVHKNAQIDPDGTVMKKAVRHDVWITVNDINDINNAPVASPLNEFEDATENEVFTFDASQYFSDPDGDALTYSYKFYDTLDKQIGRPSWLHIKDKKDSDSTLTDEDYLHDNSILTGTPNFKDAMSFRVEVTATELSGSKLSASADFTLAVNNSGKKIPYIIEPDKILEANVNRNEELIIELKGYDPDTGGRVTKFTLRGSSDGVLFKKGNNYVSSIEIAPSHRQLDNNNRYIDYAHPTVKFVKSGEQTIYIDVTDERGNVNTVPFEASTEVTSYPLKFTGLDDITAKEYEVLNLPVASAFASDDPDLNLEYQITGLPDGISYISSGPGAGRITGELLNRTAGEYEVNITATDKNDPAVEAKGSFKLTVEDVVLITMDEGQDLESSISSLGFDGAKDSEYQRRLANTEDWIKLSADHQTITFEPGRFVGREQRYALTVEAFSTATGSKRILARKYYFITVVDKGDANDAPTGTITDEYVPQGESFTHDVSRYFDDPNNDPVRYAATYYKKQRKGIIDPHNGDATSTSLTSGDNVMAEWEWVHVTHIPNLYFDGTTGLLGGRATLDNAGDYQIEVVATETTPEPLSGFTNFFLYLGEDTPTNRQPVITSITGEQNVVQGKTYSFEAKGIDDGVIDRYEWKSSEGLEKVTWSSNQRNVEFKVNGVGSQWIEVRAIDEKGLASEWTRIAIKADIPMSISSAIPFLYVDDSTTARVSANDPDDLISHYEWKTSYGLSHSNVTGPKNSQVTITGTASGSRYVSVRAHYRNGETSEWVSKYVKVVQLAPMPTLGISVTKESHYVYKATASDFDGAIKYEWKATDGLAISGSGRTVSLTASTHGKYTVWVRGQNDSARWTDWFSKTITIDELNPAPNVSLALSANSVSQNTPITATVSSGNDADIAQYKWESSNGLAVSGSGKQVTLTPTATGQQWVRVSAKSHAGVWSEPVTRYIDVSPSQIQYRTSISGAGSFSLYSRSGSGQITVTDANGISASNVTLGNVPSWMSTFRTQVDENTVKFSLSFNRLSPDMSFPHSSGIYTVTLDVFTKDNLGATTTGSVNVDVSNDSGSSTFGSGGSVSLSSLDSAGFYSALSLSQPVMLRSAPMMMAMSEPEPEPVMMTSSTTLVEDRSSVEQQKTKPLEKSYWFTYDDNNRVEIDGGSFINNRITIQEKGNWIRYDNAGRKKYLIDRGGVEAKHYTYDVWGQTSYIYQAYNADKDLFFNNEPELDETSWRNSSHFTYNAAGQVKQHYEYFSPYVDYKYDFIKGMDGDNIDLDGIGEDEPDTRERYRVTVNYGGSLKSVSDTNYNAAGEVGYQRHRNIGFSVSEQLRATAEQDNGTYEPRTYFQRGAWQEDDLTVESTSRNYQYDAAGRLDGYDFISNSLTRHFDISYTGRESYLETAHDGVAGEDDENLKDATTVSSYDVNGNRTRVEEWVTDDDYEAPDPMKDTKATYMRYDAEGKLMTKVSGKQSRALREGDFTETANYRLDPRTGELMDWITPLAEDVKFEENKVNGAVTGDYHLYSGEHYLGNVSKSGNMTVKQNHFATTEQTSSTSAMHPVRSGDTLRSLAKAYYGSEDLWYVIADANGLGFGSELQPGTTLEIPGRASEFNGHDAFSPINLSEAIGDTTPEMPYVPPPPQAGCNALASVVMIAVAVVSTIYTAGAAANLMVGTGSSGLGFSAAMTSGMTTLAGGTVTGAAVAGGTLATTTIGTMVAAGIGGFAGSVASQLAGKAMGAVDSFSLKNALSSGLTTVATAGMGSYLQGVNGATTNTINSITKLKNLSAAGKAVMGATTAISSVAANKLVGNQASFRWGNVAASALASYAGAKVGLGDPNTLAGGMTSGDIILDTFGGVANSGLHYGADKLFGNEASWNFGSVAADAFGNALGNSIVSGLASKPTSTNSAQAKGKQNGASSLTPSSANSDVEVFAYSELKKERELYAKWDEEGELQAAELAKQKFEYREAGLEAHFTELHAQREAVAQEFLAGLNDPYRDAIKPISIFPVEWGIDEAISVGQEAYNFSQKPSWQSAALLGASLIPGKFIDDAAGKVTNKLFGSNGQLYSELDTNYVSYSEQLEKATTFKTNGINSGTASAYLDTSDGQNYLDALWAADPTADADMIYARAMDQLSTGSDLPTTHIMNSSLVKIVPEGSSVSPYSPFFTTQDELFKASASNHTLADYFGLPLVSEAPSYSIFEIKPLQPAGVFSSTVAPTVEFGGLIHRNGNGIQYLVPNRNLWSEPQLIGTTNN